MEGINFQNPILYRVLNYFGQGATSPNAQEHFKANDDSGMATVAEEVQKIFLTYDIFYPGLADFFYSFETCSLSEWGQNFDLCNDEWKELYEDVSYRSTLHRNATKAFYFPGNLFFKKTIFL